MVSFKWCAGSLFGESIRLSVSAYFWFSFLEGHSLPRSHVRTTPIGVGDIRFDAKTVGTSSQYPKLLRKGRVVQKKKVFDLERGDVVMFGQAGRIVDYVVESNIDPVYLIGFKDDDGPPQIAKSPDDVVLIS